MVASNNFNERWIKILNVCARGRTRVCIYQHATLHRIISRKCIYAWITTAINVISILFCAIPSIPKNNKHIYTSCCTMYTTVCSVKLQHKNLRPHKTKNRNSTIQYNELKEEGKYDSTIYTTHTSQKKTPIQKTASKQTSKKATKRRWLLFP